MAISHQVQKVSWWHESIVDWMLKNPEQNQGDCARHFDCSESYISILMHSDAFADYFARRREDHNKAVSKDVIEQVEEVASISLEVLQERIDRERETIGLSIVNATCDLALKALGFGVKHAGPQGNTQNVLVMSASPDQLQSARDKMKLINAVTVPPDVGSGEVREASSVIGNENGELLTEPVPAAS